VEYEVKATTRAAQQIDGLRGPRKTAYEQFEQELARQGCAAFAAASGVKTRSPKGYRLTGEPPLPGLCVRHLRGSDRVVVAFSGEVAWVLLVGPHDEGDRAANIYRVLYEIAGVAVPSEPRTKPPCCDSETLDPPALDSAVVDEMVQRARALRRRSG
jgi:hypothetical protein